MPDRCAIIRTGTWARRAGIRWSGADARLGWVPGSAGRRSREDRELGDEAADGPPPPQREADVLQAGDSRSTNTTIEMIYGHVHLTETVIALTLAGFAAFVGYVAIRYRDSPERMPSSRTKTIALGFSVTVGLLAFVIWLTVFVASADSRRA